MPVFDFNSAPEDKKEVQCTYTTFCSNEDHATPECRFLFWITRTGSGIIIPAVYLPIRISRPHLSLMKRTERAVQIS